MPENNEPIDTQVNLNNGPQVIVATQNPAAAQAQAQVGLAQAGIDKKIVDSGIDQQEEGWMKQYWRPAMAFVYMAICIFDFIVMPVWVEKTTVKPVEAIELARKMPEKDQVMALQILTKEQYWNPITLKENGFIHIAFGFILGIAAWTRGQAQIAQIAQIKNQQ
jgi:hypothetical protein